MSRRADSLGSVAGRLSSALWTVLIVAGCGGDDEDVNAWEATGEQTTTSTTTGTTTTTDPSTTGSETTSGNPTVTDTDATGSTGEPAVPDSLFHTIAGGEFGPVGDMAPPVDGRAQLLRALTGLSTVELAAGGLDASTEYAFALHRQPCPLQDGGTHYLVDAAGADNNANRLRMLVTTDANGVARGSFTFDHVVRRDGMSVVVRAAGGGPKLGCADLRVDALDPIEYEGVLASFAEAESEDESIAGDVSLEVEADGSVVIAQVVGLTEEAEYATAVHRLPCASNDGGEPYERDPGAGGMEDNQLLLDLDPNSAGAADDTLTVDDHPARPDAQSVVIQRVVTDMMMMTTELKVACADLVRSTWPDVLTTRGDVQTLAVGTDRGYTIAGVATMIRQDTGWTAVEASLTGLGPSQTHPVLVHDRPCAGPGQPYAINPGIGEMIQSNEMWLLAVADDEGTAEVSEQFDHLARADAMSLVVADPDDGEVLACADLTRP